MGNTNPFILPIIGLLVCSFIAATLSEIFVGDKGEGKFSGVIYEQPVLDGRYKRLNIGSRRVKLPQYEDINQGDYIEIDFGTCDFDSKFNNYTNCDVIIDESKQNQFLKYVLQIRNKIIERVKTQLPSPHDYLLLAMTIGYEDNLPEPLISKLKDIGAIHMLVVSGYNVSLVLSSSGIILMRFNRWVYVVSSILLLILFILLTGFDAPIMRSVIMGVFVVISKALERPGLALYFLILSAVIMLSWNLDYAQNISFQLSFAATFGVIVTTMLFKNLSGILSDLAASIGASLFVLPVISYYFGNLGFLGVISSILLGWLVSPITYLGILIFTIDHFFIRLFFMIFANLFLWLSDLVANFSFLNIDYQLNLKNLCLYYTFTAMVIFSIYRFRAAKSDE